VPLTLADLAGPPPDDDLERILVVFRELPRELWPPEPTDSDLLPNDHLLEFHPDGTPTWWPMNRSSFGEDEWTVAERRRLLLARLSEDFTPEAMADALRTRSAVRYALWRLRVIAYEAARWTPELFYPEGGSSLV
jgi:hypothetical protein